MSARSYPYPASHIPTRVAAVEKSIHIPMSVDLPGDLVLKVERRGPGCDHTRQSQAKDTAASTAPTTNALVGLALNITAREFRVEVEEIIGRSRALPIATARHASWWLLRRTGRTLAWIGRQFSRDHGTILYGVQALQRRLNTEPELRADLESLLTRFDAELTRG